MKKLKLMLVMLACFVGSFAWQSVQAAKYTAYVIYADAGWTPNRAHVWEIDEPGKRTEWPGTEMTLTDSGKKFGGKTVWQFEFEVTAFTPKNIIFGKDDKSEATDNCVYPGDNSLFIIKSERSPGNSNRNKISVEANPVFDGGGDEPTPTPRTYKAYLVNNSGWTSGVRAHIWEQDKDGYKTTWPGVTLTLTDTGKKYNNQQVYSFDVNLTFDPKNILFNNPADENAKTSNKSFGEGYLYVLDGTTCTAYDKDSWSYDSTPEPTPANVLYMFGNINGTNTWTTPESGFNLGTPVGSVYTYKIKFTTETSWFKFKFGNDKEFRAVENNYSVKFDVETTAKTANGSGNAFVVEAGAGKNFELNKEYTITVTYNGTGDELTFKFTGDTPAPTPTYPATIDIKGWPSGSGTLKTFESSERDADGKYKFTLDFPWDINWFFETSDARYVPEGSSNLKIADGTYTSQKKAKSYTSTQFSSDKGEYDLTAWFEDEVIKFTVAKHVVTETYEDLYIVGTFTEGWTFRERFKASSTDGVYEWKLSSFPYAGGEWKISGEGFSVEYSAGTIMPEGNAPARTIDFNTTYTCNSKKSGESKGLGNMIMSANADKAVTVKLDLTANPPVLSLATEGDVVRPDKYLTLYMSFGQERLSEGDRNLKPRVHFFNTRQTKGVDKSSIAAWKASEPHMEMEKVYPYEPNSPLWKFTVTEEQLKSVKDVVFYFFKPGFDTDHDKHGQCVAGLAENWDAENWTKYIYFADNGKAAQSYITAEQYDDIRGKDKESLYIIGQGFDGLNGWGNGPMPDDAGQLQTIKVEASEGVFYQNIVLTGNQATATAENESEESSGAKFKMSWIRPYDYWLLSEKSGGDQDAQRSWATFNLGIIGFDVDKKNELGDKLPMILSKDVKDETGKSINRAVFCTPQRIQPLNNYNQYDWFIRNKYFEEGVTYTLVVDLNPECQTVSLIPCSPNPSVMSNGVSVESLDLSADPATAVKIWENSSDRLKAEGTNGSAVFTTFNFLTASATIDAPSHQKIKDLTDPVSGNKMNYDIYYEIYSSDQKVGTYKGEPGSVIISGVSLGDKSSLGIRARYESPVTGLQFHSKTSAAEIVATGTTIESLAVKSVTNQTFTGGTNNLDDETDPFYTLGAYGLVEVEKPSTTLVWYPDFRLTTEGHHLEHPQHANGGEIVVPGHHVTGIKTVQIDSIEYTPSDGLSFDPALNDWSGKLRDAAAWPLHLPEVVKITRTYSEDGKTFTEDIEEKAKATINIEAYAVYPFIVNPNAEVTIDPVRAAKSAPRKAPAVTPDAGYVVKLEHSTPASGTFSLGSGDLTAVRDLIAAPAVADGPVEYYNLQGVRMHGDLAPGLYIRRQGTETAKVVIR